LGRQAAKPAYGFVLPFLVFVEATRARITQLPKLNFLAATAATAEKQKSAHRPQRSLEVCRLSGSNDAYCRLSSTRQQQIGGGKSERQLIDNRHSPYRPKAAIAVSLIDTRNDELNILLAGCDPIT